MNDDNDKDNGNKLGLEVIRVLVSHGGKDLLGIRQLGRLSLLSKSAAAILDEALVWKKLFEEAATCGRGSYGEHGARSGDYGHFLIQDHPIIATHNDCLLSCFSDPLPAVVERVGYKRAAGCLLGKSCMGGCGNLAGQANPLTLQRMCGMSSCSGADDEPSYMIAKSKAKEAFLLTEKDVNTLLSIKAEYDDIGFNGKPLVCTLFLLSEVKEVAFAKYGGEEGLAAAFATKKASADQRYRQKLLTAKPQKKRPKIMRMWDRPADNLRVLRSLCLLPVGTVFDTTSTPMKMSHSFKCTKCQSGGCLADIVAHEKLEHGFITNFKCKTGLLAQMPPPTVCPEFEGLIPISNIIRRAVATTQQHGDDLADLFASATFEYSRLDYELEFFLVEKRKVCTITFPNNNVKVCVDFLHVPDPFTSLYSAHVEVWFQHKEHGSAGAVPLKLLNFNLDCGACSLSTQDSFHEENFATLAKALDITAQDGDEDGVQEVAPLVMAMFLSRVRSSDSVGFYGQSESDDNYHPSGHILMYHQVFDILDNRRAAAAATTATAATDAVVQE